MQLGQQVTDMVNRGLDKHLRLAVTGLSRAGKTAFITSLVNQLLHSATQDNLPLFDAAREGQLLGAKRIPQTNLMVPRFEYDLAIEQLSSEPPQWPEPTRDVSEIRLAIRFTPRSGPRKYFSKTTTMYLDIVDYPGEWLLDLPLLSLDFATWSQQQLQALKGMRADIAQYWVAKMQDFDPSAAANENEIAELAKSYTQYLHHCKKEGLHWIQPGRFVLPGELEGAPVLQFFPYQAHLLSSASSQDESIHYDKHSNYAMLEARYNEYKKKIVKAFYQEHFSTFDRQIILVDCLQPLNAGYDSFMDMSMALDELMQSFKYGRNSLLKRLFSGQIDKVLFAATKADHITPDQHANQLSLLQQLVDKAWQHIAFEGISMECVSLASIQATQVGFVGQGDGSMQAIQGTTLTGDQYTLFPGEVPSRLPARSFWDKQGFEFYNYRPQAYQASQSLPHIRMDKALQFLLGDKLK